MGYFLPFYPLIAQKTKILKNWKKCLEKCHHFTYVYQKLWSDEVRFLRYGEQQTEGWTDRQKKWHIEVGALPKKLQQWTICDLYKSLPNFSRRTACGNLYCLWFKFFKRSLKKRTIWVRLYLSFEDSWKFFERTILFSLPYPSLRKLGK